MSEEQLVTVTKQDGSTEQMTAGEFADLSEREMEAVVDVSPGSFTVHCTRCHEETEVDWSDLQSVLSTPCGTCELNDQEHGEMALGESYEKAIAAYKLHEESLTKLLKTKEGRPDYWDYVVHFTRYEGIVGILEEGRIEARPTGLFTVPAICMTDTPIVHSEMFRRIYGEYGLVFTKADILQAGGGPAVYLNDEVISAQKTLGFHEALKPFVNVYRHPATAPDWAKTKFVDFLHHREWRVPRDLNLEQTVPCGIIFPKAKSIEDKLGPRWSNLVRAAYEYGPVKDGLK